MSFFVPQGQTRSVARRVEVAILIALAIFLPWYEVPKNLLWLAYSVTWLVNRVRSGDFGGPWDRWDSIILFWVAGALVAGLGIEGHRLNGADLADMLRLSLMLWMVRRAAYRPVDALRILRALAWGALPALLFAYWELFGDHVRGWLELNSVGHVNHSALYLAMTTLLLQSLLVIDSSKRDWKFWTGVLLTGFYVLSLYVMASRAAMAAYAFGVLLCLMVDRGASLRARLVQSGILLVFAAVLVGSVLTFSRLRADWMPSGGLINKFNGSSVLSERDRLFTLSLEAWRAAPWTGLGLNRFGSITLDEVCQWRAARIGLDQSCPRESYITAPHAHNLYLNTLVERGVLGFAGVLALLLALALSFGRAVQDTHAGLVRMAAVSTWFVVVFGGVLNTSLHHEHGLFAVLVFGLWVGLRHPPPPVQRASGAGLRHLWPIALILLLSLVTIWAYTEQSRRAQAEARERALVAQLENQRLAEQRQALINDLNKRVPDGATRFELLAARGLNVDKPFEEAPRVIQQWRGQTTLVKQGMMLALDFPRMSVAQCRELLESAPQWVGVVRVATTTEAIDEMQLPVAQENIAKSCRSGGVPVRYVIDLRRWVEWGAS